MFQIEHITGSSVKIFLNPSINQGRFLRGKFEKEVLN